MLTLESPKGSIIINKEAALKLELKLNVSIHAQNWIIFGDTLYDTHVHGKEATYSITEEQFYWVLNYI